MGTVRGSLNDSASDDVLSDRGYERGGDTLAFRVQ